jgi:peptidoglycan/LPS O-acetylase OafA/YrhL
MQAEPTPAEVKRNARLPYRADIDGLRAVAILCVVLYHAFPTKLRGGFIGVDIFFVISGYLICGIILRSNEAGSFGFAEFYAHRIKRLFPALAVVFAGVFAFGWVALLPEELKQLGKHMAAGAGFTENFALWNEAGYFDSSSELKPLMHLWSLAIEEQFYLVFPVAIWLAGRARLRPSPVIATTLLLSFLANIASIHADPTGAFFLPHTRVWELLAGAALASAEAPGAARACAPGNPGRDALLCIVGTILILGAAFGINRNKAFPGFWALLPVLGALLLIKSGPGGWVNRRILASKPMVFIGAISYPLYLWHWPLFSFAKIVESDTPSEQTRVFLVALSFLCAWLTYRFVERPVRFGPATWRKIGVLVLLISAGGCAGYITYVNDGFESRENVARYRDVLPDAHHKAYNRYVEAHFYPCTPVEMRQNFTLASDGKPHCAQSEASAIKTVAIVGDSHAEHLFIGMAEQLRGRENVVYYFNECLPFRGLTGTPGCDRMSKTVEYVISDPTIKTVVLASAWVGRSGDSAMQFEPRAGARSGERTVFETALRSTVERFTAAKKRVYLVLSVPEFPKGPYFCAPSRPFAPERTEVCSVRRSDYEAATRSFEAVLQKALAGYEDRVHLIRPEEYLCDRAQCWIRRGGALLYRDTNHLSVEGSKYVGGAVAREIFGLRGEESAALPTPARRLTE